MSASSRQAGAVQLQRLGGGETQGLVEMLAVGDAGQPVGARLAPCHLQVAAQTVDLGHAGAQVALDLGRLVLHPLGLLDHAAHDRADPLAGGCLGHPLLRRVQRRAEPGGLAAERRNLTVQLGRELVQAFAGCEQRALLGDADEEALIEFGAPAFVQELAGRLDLVERPRERGVLAAEMHVPDAKILGRGRQPQCRQRRQYGVRSPASLNIMPLARHSLVPLAARSCLARLDARG